MRPSCTGDFTPNLAVGSLFPLRSQNRFQKTHSFPIWLQVPRKIQRSLPLIVARMNVRPSRNQQFRGFNREIPHQRCFPLRVLDVYVRTVFDKRPGYVGAVSGV